MDFLSNLREIKVYKLGEIYDFQKGINFKPKDYRETGAPVLKIRDIRPDSKIHTGDLNYCDPRSHKNSDIIRYGDVVIATSGSTSGKVGINLTNLEFFPAADIIKFKPNDAILRTRYLYHFLLSAEEQIKGLVTDGIIPHLYKSSLEKLQIPVPSLEVQEIISKKLDTFGEI